MAPKRPFRNRLNELTAKDWIKFQKSWFIHRPVARSQDTLRHPAKFPESLAQEFIEFFTKRGQTVLDPMVGTGSTLIACLRSGRHAIGVEINPAYVEICHNRLQDECAILGVAAEGLQSTVIQGDANQLAQFNLPLVDYVFTSPPYWDMLHARGAETQRRRRLDQQLDVYYSDDPDDLGNVHDYNDFLLRLEEVYRKLALVLKPGAYLTIIIKNVKKGGRMYPLAWDLARKLGEFYTLKDERIWCQDDIRLAPYGIGNAWVSNTFHHYCLQFRYEPKTGRISARE